MNKGTANAEKRMHALSRADRRWLKSEAVEINQVAAARSMRDRVTVELVAFAMTRDAPGHLSVAGAALGGAGRKLRKRFWQKPAPHSSRDFFSAVGVYQQPVQGGG